MLDNLVEFFSSGANIGFFIFALFAIGGAIFMISFTKVVHMVVSLAVTFISLAGLYVLLDAEFLAFAQILVYAGAISILMIFGIMMTQHKTEEEPTGRPIQQALIGLGVIALFGIIFYAIQQTTFQPGELPHAQDNTLEIGLLLFNNFVIPFELVSVLLTVAFIGAIVLAKREED